MAKSHRGRNGSIPLAAMAPRLGGVVRTVSLADLLPRAKPASDLEFFLARDPVVTPKSRTPGAPRLPSVGPKSLQISLGKARESNRLARDGARLIHQGRQGEAIPLLQRSVKLDPGVWASHHDLGVAMTTAGLLEQAIEPFAAALRLNPGLASAHNYLAYIFDSMGQESRAMASYQAAVAVQPNLVMAQMRLGMLYLTQSRNAEAVAAFRAATSAAPGNGDGPDRRSMRLGGLRRPRRSSRRCARHGRDVSGGCGSPRVPRQASRRGGSFGGSRGELPARYRACAGYVPRLVRPRDKPKIHRRRQPADRADERRSGPTEPDSPQAPVGLFRAGEGA